jgi:acyl carrier protein
MKQLTRDEIVEGLRGALDRASNGRAQLGQLGDDARIIEDVGLSSLDLLELRCDLEELWQTTIKDEELMALRTVGDVVRLVQQRTGAA